MIMLDSMRGRQVHDVWKEKPWRSFANMFTHIVLTSICKYDGIAFYYNVHIKHSVMDVICV